MRLLFQRINWKSPKNLQFPCSQIPRDSLPWSTTIRLSLFKKGENFRWGSLISLGPNSVLSVLTNGHIPDHRCYTTAIYLYDLCQVRSSKIKTCKQTDSSLFFLYVQEPTGQVRSQWGIWHARPHSPRLQQGRALSHKIHKETQSPNIVIIIMKTIKKTKHTHTQTYLGILKKTLYFKSILITLIFCLYIPTSSIHWSWTTLKTLIN